jgi:glycosyltransferase involved in cell wall biosynthesis
LPLCPEHRYNYSMREIFPLFNPLSYLACACQASIMLDVAVCAKVPLGEWKAGSPTHLHEFISCLSGQARVEAYVPYVAPDYSNGVASVHETNSRYRNPIFNMYHFSSKAQLALLGGRRDVVHWRLDLAQWLALLKLARGIKVAEINGPLLEEQALMRRMPGPVYWAAKRELIKNLRRFDRIVTVSDELKVLYQEAYGVPADRISVVYNGVNQHLFSVGRYREEAAALRERLGVGGKKVLGFVGGLRPWHGVQHVIRMMAGLKHRDAVLCIVGSGHELENLRSLADALGLRDRVIFIGAVPYLKVPPYVEMFDIALAPYPSQGVSNYFNPLKLFEYMAMQKPIVCGSTSWAYTFLGGDSGVIVDCEDTQRFAARVDELLENNSLAAFIASNAVRKALKNYTWEANVKAMLKAYEEAQN